MIRGLITATTLLLLTTTTFAGSFVVKDTQGILDSNLLRKQELMKPVFPSLGLYKMRSTLENNNGATKRLLLEAAASFTRQSPANFDVFNDHTLTLRNAQRQSVSPNDVDFIEQWSLGDFSDTFGINATQAWSVTTGGINALNQKVVIAVVDGGFDITQEDLITNTWVNTSEIAGNGIDDDNNGYIDDINGWNVDNNSGVLDEGRHGTHVAGIAGATGDNEVGITGVNWNVEVMLVSMGSSLASTTETLEAYNYILNQKKKWLETNGEEGANVVAINSSFGIDLADCTSDEYSLWNDVYNELGRYGILSAAATANRDLNVDESGDVPTSCSSPYIISVTNSNNDGEKANSAAYGLETIDLAAPGTDVISTLPNDSYGELSGTSMSTPHVAGSVGLIYAAASQELSELAMSDPSQTALIVKDLILNTVSPVESLEESTVSGGILNLGEATLAAQSFSTSDTPPDTDDDDDGNGDSDGSDDSTDDEDNGDGTEPEDTFSSNESVLIPDAFFSPGIVFSKISDVSEVEDINNLSVTVVIDHPYHSDLSIELIAPNGNSILLKYKKTNFGLHTYVFSIENSNSFEQIKSLGSSVEAGDWYLQVTDHLFDDKGVLENWSIKTK